MLYNVTDASHHSRFVRIFRIGIMKILVDIRLLARGGASGIEEYTRSLLTRLLATNARDTYHLFYNGLFARRLPEAWRTHERVSVTNWRIPNRLLEAAMRFRGEPAVDARFLPNLVWSPHFTFLAVRATPRIMTIHDLSFLHHPDFFSRRQRLWHSLQAVRRQAEQAAHLIAVSEFTKSDLVTLFGIKPEHISVIYSGVDADLRPLREDDAGLSEFRTRHGLTFPFILSLGTLEPRKNVPAIIRAFNILKDERQFRDLRLVIAGRRGWLYQSILSETRSSPHRAHIIFWGPVAARDKLYLLNLAAAFAYPSFFEGFGFPPLEAQACGCPAVVADRTSLPEVVGDSALRVNPWRIDELAEALRAALTKSAVRRALIRAGLENVKRFDWRLTAHKVRALFNRYA